MGNEDWYRNIEWNDEIEEAFYLKLKRARRKEQYLRIQASILSTKYPDISLALLDKYFELKDDFDHAQAYCDMASAFISKNMVEDALNAYEKALNREREFPNLKTDAYILFPLTIVKNKLEHLYSKAETVLNANQSRLMFPIDFFRWHAALAIINSNNGNAASASKHAEIALESAQIKKSRFTFHQNLSLVGKEYKGIVKELRKIYA